MPTLLHGASTNPNRLVAVLTPLVFAPLAGAIAAGVAKYGIDVDDGQVQAIFIAGATIALAKSAQWTKGWQAHEQRLAAAVAEPIAVGREDDLDEAEVDVDDVEAGDEPRAVAFDEPVAEDDLDDVEVELDAAMESDHHDDMDSDHDDDMDSDHDDDMHDDLDAEASELLVGQGS